MQVNLYPKLNLLRFMSILRVRYFRLFSEYFHQLQVNRHIKRSLPSNPISLAHT